jgi:hypothetical protein
LQAQCNIEFLALIRTKDYTIKRYPAPHSTFREVKVFSKEAADTLIFYDNQANDIRLYFPTIRVYTTKGKKNEPYTYKEDYNCDQELCVTKVRTKGLHKSKSNSNRNNTIRRKPIDSNNCVFDTLDKYLWLYYACPYCADVRSRTIFYAWFLEKTKIVSSPKSPIIIVYPSIVFFKQALDSSDAKFYSDYERNIKDINEPKLNYERYFERSINSLFINCLVYSGGMCELEMWLAFRYGPRKKE